MLNRLLGTFSGNDDATLHVRLLIFMKPNCFSDKSLDFRGSHYAFVLYRGEYLFAQGGDKGKQVKHDIVMKPESAKKQTGFFKSNKSR